MPPNPLDRHLARNLGSGSVTEVGRGHTRTAIRSALYTSTRLLRARWRSVLVAMLCVQGALVWTLPLMASLVRWTLGRLGIDGVNQYTLGTIASSSLALLVLVTVAVVATLFVLVEVTLFAVIAHLSLEGEEVTFTGVLRRSRATARAMVGPQGLLLIPYLTILLPISEVGFSSVLTHHVVIPQFITGELLKTSSGTLLYLAVMTPITYAMLRLLLFPAIISGSDVSIVQALGRSLRMTHWRALLGFGAVMLGTTVTASLVLALLAGIGLGPVAWAGTHTTAGIVLGLLELARFLVAGTAAAFVAFFFVAYLRSVQDRPRDVRTSGRAPRRTRVASATVIVVSASIATPHLAEQVDAATAASRTSPVVIGHRGYPSRAVENSIEGLRAADEAGAEMVETDIQETRDDGLVVMHDVGLGRLTGVDRDVYELSESEVSDLTLRQDGRTASVPTLEEFVREADERGVRLLVELKPHGQEGPGFARTVAAELDRLDPDHTHMVQSLDRDLIEEISHIDRDRPTAFVVGVQIGALPTTSSGAVVVEDWSVHDRMVAEARRQGRDLYTWTLNDVGALRGQMVRGVDGVITDEVDRAVATRDRVSAGPVTFYLERARGLVAIQ